MTVDSLNGVPIQEYSLNQFRQLGIGDKELNNGILILLSKTDKKVRIEIGYGLEGALPDSKAGQILDEVMLPALKKRTIRTRCYARIFCYYKRSL